ncbi:hypothetical protein BDQ12DRAFT_772956 [Crucibulum laeve]|uniref:DUF6533 domain-containing protein n=1 Tax=Crucibulum laeve TaxID=68775 RepID=A0A5C3LHK6_9AGAR|nr:hypothetical protein BDQ12DRAFT_772956 [Crucibulum laeve]
MEVKYIWKGRFRASNILYVFCRYAMVANILYLLAIINRLGGTKVSYSCDTAYQVSSALSVVVVLGARTYAIFGRNHLILLIFGPLELMVLILAAVRESPRLIVNAHHHFSASRSLLYTVVKLLSIFTVIFEILSTIFTTFRTVQAMRVAGNWKLQQNTLSFLILQQELTHYLYSAVTGFNTAVLILNFASSFFSKLLNALTVPLSGVMTARFLLHLREWEDKKNAHYSAAQKSTQSMAFATSARQNTNGARSMFDDFGEDPVREVRNNRADIIT